MKILSKLRLLFGRKIRPVFTTEKPIDWFAQKKRVHIFYRSNTPLTPAPYGQSRLLATRILSIQEINDPVVIIEYIELITVEIMVSGGDDRTIAEAIFQEKPVGVATKGNTNVMVNFMDIPHSITFTKLDWVGDILC